MSTKKTAARTEVDATILAIAKEHLLLETLESRNMDSLDFSDQSVVSIRQALAAAFAAGQGFEARRIAKGGSK
jgi:hypothetical protein